MLPEVRAYEGLLNWLDHALGRVLWRAVSGLVSCQPGGTREQPEAPQDPDSEEPPASQEPDIGEPESSIEPVETEEPAAGDHGLLDRLAAGDSLSPEGNQFCRRLLDENRGYQPDSVLDAAICDGRLSAEDLAKIAVILESMCYEPGADTPAIESLTRNVFQILADRGVATEDLVRECVQAAADAPCLPLARPVVEYLKRAGRTVPEYRARVVAAFSSDNYAAYCGKQPAAGEERPFPATWNEWESYDAWNHAGSDWPLAELFLELDTAAEIDALLAAEPPAGVPAEHTLHYFLLRRAWLKGRESPGSLRSLGRLLRATAGKPQWKPLHDRGLLVFRDAWNRSQAGRAMAMAAEVYQGLLGLQPKIDPRNPPDRLPGMSRLHSARPQRQQPEEDKTAAPPELLLPSKEALLRRFKRLRADVDERPDNPGAWHEIAGIYEELSLWDKAIIAEGLAIEHHPKFVVAYYGRGKARMEVQQWADAVADFSSAIRLWEFPGGLEKFLTIEEPRDEYVDSYRTRGVAHAHQGDHDAAIEDVATAIRLRRHDARLHYELAYLQDRAGRTPDARIEAYNAGLLYLDRGGKEGAAECVALLDRLEAHDKAEDLRNRSCPRKPGDLPE